MTLTEKVKQLKANGVAGIRVALQWEKMIHEHGEDRATAFYTSLGLNHLEKKSIEWEGLTLSREPTEAEKVCVKGIAGAQESSKQALTAILTSLRTQLISDGLEGIAKLKPATYHKLILSVPPEFRLSLRDRLIGVHRQGRALVATELGRQKKQDDEDEFYELDTLTDVTDSRISNDVQARVISAAARFTLLGLVGAALLGSVREEVQTGSVSYIDRAATGLANRVINIGRSNEASDRGYGSVEYSALLDQNVCGPCAAEDGTTATNEDGLQPAPNLECEGGDWCRCFHVYIAEGSM